MGRMFGDKRRNVVGTVSTVERKEHHDAVMGSIRVGYPPRRTRAGKRRGNRLAQFLHRGQHERRRAIPLVLHQLGAQRAQEHVP